MKKSLFSEEQIVRLLQQAERGDVSVTALCKQQSISQNTVYRWRRQFGGMGVQETRRLKELEHENARLKRLLAERDLEVDAMKQCWQKTGERSSATRGRASVDQPRHQPTPSLRADKS